MPYVSLVPGMHALSSPSTARHGTQEDDSDFGAAVKKELTSALKAKAEGSALALADAARDAEAFRRCACISAQSCCRSSGTARPCELAASRDKLVINYCRKLGLIHAVNQRCALQHHARIASCQAA